MKFGRYIDDKRHVYTRFNTHIPCWLKLSLLFFYSSVLEHTAVAVAAAAGGAARWLSIVASNDIDIKSLQILSFIYSRIYIATEHFSAG